MKGKSYLLLLGVLLMILAACAADQEEGGKESAVSDPGEVIYKKSCASCHGGDLTGGAGPALENITERYTREAITDIINHGRGTMFPVSLAAEEIEELLDWLDASAQ